MPNDNAYDRLFNNERKQSNFSYEEQLSDDTGDDENMFFRGMSQESKAALYNRVHPESIEEDSAYEDDELQFPEERPSNEEDIQLENGSEPDIDSLITPTKPKRGRKPKVDNMNDQNRINSVSSNNPYESIIRMLALNVVNALKNSSYAYAQFSHKETCLLLDYIANKIKGE